MLLQYCQREHKSNCNLKCVLATDFVCWEDPKMLFLFIILTIIPPIAYCIMQNKKVNKKKTIYVGTAKFDEVK